MTRSYVRSWRLVASVVLLCGCTTSGPTTVSDEARPSATVPAAPTGSAWTMSWNGEPVRLAGSPEDADGDPRFYSDGDGVYFEVTSPGGGEDAASLHRSIKITVPRNATGAGKLAVDLNGNFGDATLDGRKIPNKGRVDRTATADATPTVVELHDVAGKTWGWISAPAR